MTNWTISVQEPTYFAHNLCLIQQFLQVVRFFDRHLWVPKIEKKKIDTANIFATDSCLPCGWLDLWVWSVRSRPWLDSLFPTVESCLWWCVPFWTSLPWAAKELCLQFPSPHSQTVELGSYWKHFWLPSKKSLTVKTLNTFMDFPDHFFSLVFFYPSKSNVYGRILIWV